MWIYLCEMFVISLIMTECIEIIAAVCLGIRKQSCLLLIILVNCLTNPPVVFLAWTARASGIVTEEYRKVFLYIIIEILVVIAEGFIYHRFMKENEHPFLFSLCTNVISFGIGCLL